MVVFVLIALLQAHWGYCMQNPYNEGLAHGRIAGSTICDCPYKSPFMHAERNQWIAGFRETATVRYNDTSNAQVEFDTVLSRKGYELIAV